MISLARLNELDLDEVRPVHVAIAAILLGAVTFVAGTILIPPIGGFLGLLAFVLVGLTVALLILRPGLFLALFLIFGTFAPFLSRIVHLPMGWFKGTFFILLLPVWILSRAAFTHRRSWLDAARVPFICFCISAFFIGLIAVTSLIRGMPILLTFNAMKGYLLYPPMLFIALEAAGNRKQVQQFLWLVLALTGVVAVGAVVQSFVPLETLLSMGLALETGAVVFIAIDPISGKVYQRLFSILDDQFAVAAFMFMGITLSTYLLLTVRRSGERILVSLVLALNAYALLLTYNLTCILATVLLIVIVAIRRGSARMLLSLILITAVIGGIAWMRYGELITNRFIFSFAVKSKTTTSLAHRAESNREAIGMVLERPMIGRGMGSTASDLIYYRLGMRSTMGKAHAVDNVYMVAALETGLVGLSAVLLLYLLPVIGLYRLRRSRHPDDKVFVTVAGSAILVLLLANFSNGPMTTNPSNLIYWMLTGLIWRMSGDQSQLSDAAGN